MKILVSACLMGKNCKYSGGNNYCQRVIDYVQGHEVIQVCPELSAGLGVPRTPVEIVEGRLQDRHGKDVTDALQTAISQILEKLREQQIHCAVLQSRSPTCGVKQVYDGTFSGRLIPGRGVFAQALADAGIAVIDKEDI